MRLCKALAFVHLLAAPAQAQALELSSATWGGACATARRQFVVDPFAQATGMEVGVLQYDDTVASLAMRAVEEGWDVIDMLDDQSRVACADGLLAPLDPASILGRDTLDDFTPAPPSRCAIPQIVYARVLPYREPAFPGIKPTRFEDFFDLGRFPGPRAIQASPDGILEWALMAEGVPPELIYGLLSTDRGLRLAFRRLSAIRDHIVWDGRIIDVEV